MIKVARRLDFQLLTRRARLAQRRKDWGLAANLWRKAAEKAPNDRSAATGCISALIYVGEIDEALERTTAFVRARPEDENGQIALARIAEAQGNSDQAGQHWQAALERNPFHRQSLIRLGGLMVAATRFEEAQACARRLIEKYPAESYGAILDAQIAQARQGFGASAPLWREAEQRFPNDFAVLRAYGRAALDGGAFSAALAIAEKMRCLNLYDALRLEGQVLAKREPFQDHTDFWKRASALLPDNADLTRKLLHGALSARRREDAQLALERLLQHRQLQAGDADYVLGRALAELQRNDRPSARLIVRRFLKIMRGQSGYRRAALRLNRLILAIFPTNAANAVAISRNPARFARMIEVARLVSGVRNPLERTARLEGNLASQGTCLLDTDIDAESCRGFIRLVRDRLAKGTPFSLIRLGDGEANAFQSGSSIAAQSDADAAEREKVWWGRALEPAERLRLAARVEQAAWEADAIGFPTREWLLRDIRLDSGAGFAATKSGRGLLVIAEALERQCRAGSLAGKVFTSAHLPQDLHRWNLYGELFDGVDEIVLVSCHPRLHDELRHRFGTITVKHVLMPPGDSMRETEHRALTDDELPTRDLDRALNELGDWPKGRLVLVGAGYAGKVIIHHARQRGGIALDLGSIFDHWIGVHTRSYQDLS
ncbi:MAG: tetratricopeptide repeat protein [Alphaproteobacteria bacterium]|nr:tetratricopeptide repeat protein [Alphaproteobacteria bacterium]